LLEALRGQQGLDPGSPLTLLFDGERKHRVHLVHAGEDVFADLPDDLAEWLSTFFFGEHPLNILHDHRLDVRPVHRLLAPHHEFGIIGRFGDILNLGIWKVVWLEWLKKVVEVVVDLAQSRRAVELPESLDLALLQSGLVDLASRMLMFAPRGWPLAGNSFKITAKKLVSLGLTCFAGGTILTVGFTCG
jgi:hypothetical protein